MKKQITVKKDLAPTPLAPLRLEKSDDKEASQQEHQQEDHEAQHEHRHLGIRCNKPDCNFKKMKGRCNLYCLVATYVALSVLAILICAAVIVVTGLASVATKVYDAEQSSRLVAMVVLAVTAGIGLSMIIYAVIGALKRKTKMLHAFVGRNLTAYHASSLDTLILYLMSGIVLIILAIIQALVIGVAINVTSKDELSIAKYLSDSFRLAKEDTSRHVKLWSSTQSELQCCGFHSPEDYRDPIMPFYFPPNVPISCCPSFDETKPPFNQERQRELCKVNKTFFDVGCKGLVVQVFKETAMVVISIMVVLIVTEVILALVGVRLITKQNEAEKAVELEQNEHHELPQCLSNH